MSVFRGGSDARLLTLKDLIGDDGQVKHRLEPETVIYFHGFLFGPEYAKLKFPPVEFNKLVPDNRIQTESSGACVYQFTFERDEENVGTLPVCFDRNGNQLDERFWISGSGAPRRGGKSRRRANRRKSKNSRKRKN